MDEDQIVVVIDGEVEREIGGSDGAGGVAERLSVSTGGK